MKEESKIFFEGGIKNGYFRKDVNYELISEYSDISIADAIENGFLDKYGIQEVFRNITMLYVRGFCTLKGIEELEKLL